MGKILQRPDVSVLLKKEFYFTEFYLKEFNCLCQLVILWHLNVNLKRINFNLILKEISEQFCKSPNLGLTSHSTGRLILEQVLSIVSCVSGTYTTYDFMLNLLTN